MKKFYTIMAEKINNALKKYGYEDNDIAIFESNRKDLADYQYNGLMKMAKTYHKSPMEIGNIILPELQSDNFFKEVSIANPGFINMRISDKSLIDFTNIDDYNYPKNNKLIFLDYGGANVAKSLHVGHLRSANIGESLKRLCEYLGYKTISDTHLGDFGRPLGLVILELFKRYPDWVYFDSNYNGEYPDVPITSSLLEEIYPYASSRAKEDENYLKEAQVITKRLQNKEKGIYDLWLKIMEVSKKDIKEIYDRLNTSFDLYKGESDAEFIVPELLTYLDQLDIVEESEGAKVISVQEESDKLEIPPMLLLKSDGGYLYSTTELATIYERMKEYKPDEIWYIADKRQELHFTQVFRASKKANIVKEDTKLVFAGFGTMNGKDGKPFKTRDGGVMRLTDLLDQVKEECLKRLSEDMPNRESLAEIISMSAVKYADMLPNRETDYNFDIEKFCDLEGKTGPYILYTTVRMKSILNKAQENNYQYNKINKIANSYDRDLLITLNNLDLVINNAFNSISLNEITDYLYRLTTSFNRFYTENIILKEEDESLRESWLYLTKTVYQVTSILLNILAIKIPDKM